MDYRYIEVDKQGHLEIITINRAEVMNCLSPPANAEMDQVLNEFQEDPEAWVCIVTGAGDKAFSVGNDLRYLAEKGGDHLMREMSQIKGGFGGLTSRFDCYKPIIAAVNGLALGGGFEMAMACDLIIAAENAEFGLPEPRVGLIAGMGGLQRLTRQLPYHLAMGMLLACRRISAQDALRFGLINEVVPAGDLMPAARKWAEEIIKGSPLAVRASKEIAVKSLDMPLPEAVVKEFPVFKQLLQSQDFVEGPKAFIEKRAPKWQGR